MKIFNEEQVVSVLENGLTVIVHQKKGFRSTSALFGTYFGAMTLVQMVDDRKVHYPAGVAHFLEHKLFEPEEMDVLSTFTNMGANANAFTSYHETVCYFSTTHDYQEPLSTLLDFVQGFNTSEDKVEKEKGIIAQELLMYQQMPQFQLHMSLYKAMYHNLGLNQDIAGSLESIEATRFEDIMQAYQANYHPSQMVLSIVTPHSISEILSFVKNNQSQKVFAKETRVETVLLEETEAVVSEYTELIMEVTTPKVAVGFKQSFKLMNPKEVFFQELYLKYLTALVFTGRNHNYQQWLDDKIISDNFSVFYDVGENYCFIGFTNETDDEQAFKQFLTSQLDNIKLDQKDFDALKRRYIGESITSLENGEDVAVDNFRAYEIGLNLKEQIDALQNITFDELEDFSRSLRTDLVSVVKIKS